MSDKKNIEDLVVKLTAQGWRVTKRKKHYIAFPPDKEQSAVTIACTPSDPRAYKNCVSRVRKRGAEV